VNDGTPLTLATIGLLAAAVSVRRGSRSAPQIHQMKLGPWVQRLEAGMGQLRHAMKAQDRSKILDGIDDVSFWTGRVVCDVLGAAEHSPVSDW
jgi:hypothetical protein